jgi:hypothetical protein
MAQVGSGGEHGRRDNSMMVLVVLLYALALALSLAMVLRGRYDLGVAGTLLVLTLGPIAFILARGGSSRAALAEVAAHVRAIREHALLSDDARRVINRSTERELLERAIEEDIAGKNWDAALILARELSERFGFRAEADRLRERIEAARLHTRDAEITDAVGYLDGLILQRRWDQADAEAARLQRVFPDSPRVGPLRGRVADARASHKQGLQDRLLDAARADRSEEAMALLKELDPYLTPQEAEGMQQIARDVIARRRDQMGADFRLAVQERRWADAATIGDSIVAEFPNSRMAEEVAGLIEGVRAKAQGAAG